MGFQARRFSTFQLEHLSIQRRSGKKGSDTKSRNGPSGASHFWCLTPFFPTALGYDQPASMAKMLESTGLEAHRTIGDPDG